MVLHPGRPRTDGAANMKRITTTRPVVKFTTIRVFADTTGLREKIGDMAFDCPDITSFQRINGWHWIWNMNRIRNTQKSEKCIRLITMRGITAMANTDSGIFLRCFVANAILVTLISVSHSQAQVDQARAGDRTRTTSQRRVS